MKKILTNNIGLKLLSILFAVVFWLIIVNIDDPTVTRNISGIPVTPLDTEVISAQNEVYKIESGDTVSISVKGPRSEVDSLGKDDFIAEAPFSEMSNVNAVPIYVKFRNSKYEKTVEITQKTMNMKLSIENIISKNYDIAITHTADISSGYYVGKENISQSTVTVNAPQSIINLISKATVEVDLSGQSSDFSQPVSIKFYTETGTQVQLDENSNTNISTVTYSAKIYPVKEVALKFGSIGTVANGYELVDVTGEKTTLKIAGNSVEQIENIVFPDELVNIDGASKNVSVMVDVAAQLPSGVMLCNEEDASMKVTANIEKLVTNSYRVPISEIDKLNVPNGYSAEFSSQSVNISLSGLQKTHDTFNINSLTGYVDLKNAVEGSNEVVVKFNLPDGLTLENDITTMVILTKNTSNTETTTQQPQSSTTEQQTTSANETTTVKQE